MTQEFIAPITQIKCACESVRFNVVGLIESHLCMSCLQCGFLSYLKINSSSPQPTSQLPKAIKENLFIT